MTQRLIETWLPIAQIGIESLRERTPMTPFPAPNRLHVWWARRPLVASRAAILASLLPADADHDKFMQVLGIHGDPVAGRKAIAQAVRTGVRVADPYGYSRAFAYTPNPEERRWIFEETKRGAGISPTVLDPTAGGGSIPFESVRLGLRTLANDLNPVAGLLLRATIEWPATLGYPVLDEFNRQAANWRSQLERVLGDQFPPCPLNDGVDTAYLWARTITCPYCDGLIPLSPNWRLAPDGTGVHLRPDPVRKRCDFDIVTTPSKQSEGTITGGDGKCPYLGCGRVVDGDEMKRQAQAGYMGEQLYAIVFRRRIATKTKTGKARLKWERGFRAPGPEDDNSEYIRQRLDEKLSGWEADGLVPTERFPALGNDLRPIIYGMPLWSDMFSRRQLLCHGLAMEAFQQLVGGETGKDTREREQRSRIWRSPSIQSSITAVARAAGMS